MNEYERLVRKIGPGFHPDTRGEDYANLPEGLTPAYVNRVVAAEEHPYSKAITVFKQEGWFH